MRCRLLLAALLFSACATTHLETIYAPIESKGWTVANAKDVPGQGTIVERIPQGEALQAWIKMITIQFVEGETRSPRPFMDSLQAQMKQRCPSVQWTILEEDATSVLYEWRFDDCPGQSPQHELSRLLRGNDGLHRIAYVEQSGRMPEVTRKTWIDNLKSAYVVKGDPDNRVVLDSK